MFRVILLGVFTALGPGACGPVTHKTEFQPVSEPKEIAIEQQNYVPPHAGSKAAIASSTRRLRYTALGDSLKHRAEPADRLQVSGVRLGTEQEWTWHRVRIESAEAVQ